MLEFKGTGRFTVERRLGQGGMGVVYLAHDRERGAAVALKTMTRLDAAGIASLKNEFRVLAGVTHPNLVALHELVCEGGQWFFTMEVVKGQDFVTYSRFGGAQTRGPWSSHTTVQASAARSNDATTPIDDNEPASAPSAARGGPELVRDFDRLRNALRQLAEGINALHAAGKLHRDLKPSNVLVTPAGRVVILDFGLASVYGHRQAEPVSGQRQIVGTPAYMAPEQVINDSAQPASDWYAFGLILYESLTGRLPFSGDTRQILLTKRIAEPAPPGTIVEGIPDDLNQLCSDCLRRDPENRPTGLEVLRRLGVETPRSARAALSEARREQAPLLIGRDAQLAELHQALAAVRQGRAVVVYVSGKSGMGKTALIDHFLAEIRRGDAMVLTGRCYERESVPYKAWDSLIDALSRRLLALPPEEAARSMPPDIRDLARVFPVLQGAAEPPERHDPKVDQLESRRRAFGALKELVRLVPAGRPLVLSIDDLQWGDVDSAKLMVSLLSPPDIPPLLLLCSCRSEEMEESELFRELESSAPALVPRSDPGTEAPVPGADPLEMGEVRTITMDPLSREHGARLALTLLDSSAPSAPALAEAIARESEGSPFFIAELVRHGGAALEGVSLEGVLQARIQSLPEDARRLLEVLAVAARPIEQGMAASAAGLSFGETAALDVLRAGHLVRTRGAKARDMVEPYHDRVRETVTAGLDAARLRACHERLACTLEAAGRVDPEVLAAHFEGAEQPERTRHYAILAAEKAAAALAFDRAARLYRLALATWTHKAAITADRPAPSMDDSGALALQRSLLQRSLAQALVNAGRGAEAAPVFLAAALRADADEALELRRLAAEQFMVCGHFDRGAQVLRAVLPSVGLHFPETSLGAMITLLARLARLRLRGTRFEERPEHEIPAARLARIDACYSAGKGLILVDPVRGLGFFAQHLLLSLEAGEPGRVCVGLALYGANLCVAGGPIYPRARRFLDQAQALAERLDDPYLLGVAGTCAAASQMCLGQWKATVEMAARSGEILRRGRHGVAWEIESGVVFSEVSLLWMGRFNELVAFVRTHVRQALDRGDLFAATYARMHTWFSPIAADDPARASAEMRDAIGRWSQGGFHIMHFWALYGETQYELYAGNAAAAEARITAAWSALERSNILRVQFHRAFMVLLRGSTAVAAARARRSDEKRMLQAAERDARRLDAEGMHYTKPAAALLRAGIFAAGGRSSDALAQLDAAIAGFDGADMALHAACARRRRGELIGGDEGSALIAAADAYMTGQNIKNPARWTRIYAPGFDGD